MPKKKKIVKKASPKPKELPKPIRRKGEGPLEWYKRYKKWTDSRDTKYVPKKVVKPVSKPKKGKKLTEKQKRIEERKKAEKLLGMKRGVAKKPKKSLKKKKKK